MSEKIPPSLSQLIKYYTGNSIGVQDPIYTYNGGNFLGWAKDRLKYSLGDNFNVDNGFSAPGDSLLNAVDSYVNNVLTGERDFERQKELQSMEMKFNAEEAQKARDFTKSMSDTSYQRAYEDMAKVGLNPALMLGSGGASVGSSPVASSNSRSVSSSINNVPFLVVSELLNNSIRALERNTLSAREYADLQYKDKLFNLDNKRYQYGSGNAERMSKYYDERTKYVMNHYKSLERERPTSSLEELKAYFNKK